MKYLKCFEDYTVPNIPNTRNFWHGGNLEQYSDIISQKNGRYEYGSGLYLTTHRDTAIKYARGSRKLYLVTVENGLNIQDAVLDMDVCNEFIRHYILRDKINFFKGRLSEHTKDNKIKAFIFNNIILNNKLIKASNTRHLRQFYVDNGIDYDMIINAFGFGEDMMVLYNMKKIVNTIKINKEDRYR